MRNRLFLVLRRSGRESAERGRDAEGQLIFRLTGGFVMGKRTELRLAGTAVLSLLISIVVLSPALAEIKCSTSSGTCYDVKSHEYRKCTTKVCLDDKGTVISTETVVEMQGGTGGGKPPKANLPKATTGAVRQ